MIYDCFIFSNELDLLELRLSFLNETVDYFVLVESARTLSGNKKPLCYAENKDQFAEYQHKIIYLQAPNMPELTAWEYEHYQRNYIKQGLVQCKDDDIVLISDVDEIVNLKSILAMPGLQLPALIDLPYYYYFLNCKSHNSMQQNLLSKYSFIKDKHIGDRTTPYKTYVSHIIGKNVVKTGWHFSYLFGFDLPKYADKIRSFSHQEFNNSYFLNEDRIARCIKSGIDLFERTKLFFSYQDPAKDLQELALHIKQAGLDHLIFQPDLKLLYKENLIGFKLRKKIIPLIKYHGYTLPRKKLIAYTGPFRKKLKKILGRK